jgi:predicted amidophosphoribosyltransferase
MTAGPQHDAALDAAVKEISPLFKQCSRCGKWVCEPICWNKKMGLCETCAPDLDEEVAVAQASAAKDQVFEKARAVDYVGQRDLAQVAAVLCPSCGAKTQGGKFCPECGESISRSGSVPAAALSPTAPRSSAWSAARRTAECGG